MSSSLEIEVKLTGAAKALAKAWRGAVLQGDPASEEVTRSLENTYFDTADLRLRKLGYAFRIRKDGTRLVQTLKSNDEGGKGLARRREWSAVVSELAPDVEQLGDATVREEIGELRAEDLKPVFTTKIRRRQRLVKHVDEAGQISVIEVAFDEGEIKAKGEKQAVREIEFELQRGQTGAIHRLISEVLASVELRVETRSKSARGYALATGKAPTWRRADPVSLTPETSPHDAFRAIVENCLAHWLANEAAAVDGSDPEGAHQLRVALRRLRSSIAVFGKDLVPADIDWLKREVKWLLGETGAARDWDVFLDELLPPVIAAPAGTADLAGLVEAAEAMRAASYDRLRAAIASQRYTAFSIRLGAWLEAESQSGGDHSSTGENQPLPAVAEVLLEKRYRKLRKQGRHFATLTPQARHELRITLKKLRYSVEFFRALYGRKRVKSFLDRAKDLQDGLGHLNDVVVSQRLLKELLDENPDPERRAGLSLAAGVVIGWYGHANLANESLIQKSWKDFAALKTYWDDLAKKA